MIMTPQQKSGSRWSNERIELLIRLWGEGLSASLIAARLGDVTRNSVIGKVHRLGLSGRATKSTSKGRRAEKTAPQPQPKTRTRIPCCAVDGALALKPVAKPEPAPRPLLTVVARPEEEPATPGVTILELKEHMCRWPEGDPKTPDFRFCGRSRVDDRPYCARHARLVARTSNH